MSTYTWPAAQEFRPDAFTWGVRDNARSFVSELSGAMQTMSLPGTRWACMLTFPNHTLQQRPALEGFLARIRKEHRILMPRLDRPRPLGTIALTGVTLAASAAQFAGQLQLTGCGANATLLAGSMLGLPGQLLMVAESATANGSGAMTVQLTHRLRAAHAASTPVVLNSPTALWTLANANMDFPRVRRLATPLTVELQEHF